jgi:hypothetical protein
MEQAVENVQRSIQSTVEDRPAAVFLNETMISVKKLEDLIKEIRKTITDQVKTRNLQLQDFTLETANMRTLLKPIDIVHDFNDKWGQSVNDLIAKDVVKVQISKAEDLLKSLAKNLGRIPEGVKPDDWAKAETARYMAKETTEQVSLKSNTKKRSVK